MEEGAGFVEQSLLEYHLYTLGRPTTIVDNQTKQVALLSAVGVPVKKEFVLQGTDYYYRSMYNDLGTKMKVGVFIETKNDEVNHLGMPLPKGTMRVYKKDRDGSAQMVSESHPHDKSAANIVLWRIAVPAEGRATLKYKVLVRF